MIFCKTNQILGLGPEVFIFNLLLAIPVFFFLRWILKKVIKKDVIRKIATWIITLFVTPIIYIAIIIIWIAAISHYPSTEFDRTRWTSNTETRYEMSKDLINSNILIGKTKKEVIEILGDEGNDLNSNSWSYNIGFVPRLFSIDPDILTIEFVNGKVVKVGQQKT